jgi:hypothetical protein
MKTLTAHNPLHPPATQRPQRTFASGILCRHTSSSYATVGSHPPPTRRHLLVNMHVPGYSYARILVCLHACSARLNSFPHAHSLTCTIPCARMPRNPPPTRPLVYAHTHDPISTHARYRSHTNSSFFPPWLSLVTFPFSGSQAPLLPPPPRVFPLSCVWFIHSSLVDGPFLL